MQFKIDEKLPAVIAYRAAVARLQEIQSELNSKTNARDEAWNKLSQQPPIGNRIDDEVGEYLGNSQMAPWADTRVQLNDQIHKLNHEIEVIEGAIVRQREVVDQTKGPFSLHVCAGLRERYLEIERKYLRAILEAAALYDSEASLIDEIQATGANVVGMRIFRLHVLGGVQDYQSRANSLAREYREHLPEVAKAAGI